MDDQPTAPLPSGRLRRTWPRLKRIIFGVFFALIALAYIWKTLGLPFARQLEIAAFGFAVPFLILGVIEEILERRGLIDKPKNSRMIDDQTPPLPEPPPVSLAAEPDIYAEPGRASETLTPLGGGALPDRFDREGRKAIWRVMDGSEEE